MRNFLDYVCDDFSGLRSDAESNPITVHIPVNTITPSEIEGLSLADERKFRYFACEMILGAGILLKLPMVTMATA